MNALSSDQDSTFPSVQTSQLLVLQPCGSLDIAFQNTLEQAVNQNVKAIVVDLIRVTKIASDGIQALQAALKLAASLGKELVVWSADAATYTALSQERDRQQAQQMSDRTEVMHPDFSYFLNGRRQTTPTKSTATAVIQPLLKPIPAPPTLAADPYTVANWHTTNPISKIA